MQYNDAVNMLASKIRTENFGNSDTHLGLIGILSIAGMEEKHESIVESQ
jgi:hypothetical protein